MNESLTGMLVIFSEVGAMLALAAVIFLIYFTRRNHKDRLSAKTFVDNLHRHEAKRKEDIVQVLEKVHEMDHDLAIKTAHGMLTCEKQIYNRVLKIFLGHDRDGLTQLQKEVESMANAYRKLNDSVESIKVVERGENPKQNAALRIQVKQLENEKAKLEKDLGESMLSMENMLKEYMLMYTGSGAKKDGVKHIENELTQLKQKISTNLVEAVDEGDIETPDLDPAAHPSDDELGLK
jgi:uncharacterized membrane protein